MTRQPATRAHNDYTERSAPRRVRDLMGDGVDMLLGTRYEFINVWWPIRGPQRDVDAIARRCGCIWPDASRPERQEMPDAEQS